MEQAVVDTFNQSYKNYGTRRIKAAMQAQGYVISRRKIGQIMKQHDLVSNYTRKKYKPYTSGCNEAKIPNILNREFNRDTALDVVVSDLTYVRVKDHWCYICLIIDLWNREIVGWSVGERKNAELVQEALYSIPYRLDSINVFHSDRGKEFDNKLIDDVVAGFRVERSLSRKGCPYDNAVIESANKTLKVEFAHQHIFSSLGELRALLAHYIDWYNNVRLHSSLGYHAPASVRARAIINFYATLHYLRV